MPLVFRCLNLTFVLGPNKKRTFGSAQKIEAPLGSEMYLCIQSSKSELSPETSLPKPPSFIHPRPASVKRRNRRIFKRGEAKKEGRQSASKRFRGRSQNRTPFVPLSFPRTWACIWRTVEAASAAARTASLSRFGPPEGLERKKESPLLSFVSFSPQQNFDVLSRQKKNERKGKEGMKKVASARF